MSVCMFALWYDSTCEWCMTGTCSYSKTMILRVLGEVCLRSQNVEFSEDLKAWYLKCHID